MSVAAEDGEGGHAEELRGLGVNVVVVQRRGHAGQRLLEMTRAVRALRPDVVQSVHAHMNLRALIAARACHVKAIGALRTDPVRSVHSMGRLGPQSLRWPDTLVGNSRRHLNSAVQNYGVRPGRCVHLRNWVDIPRAGERQPDPLLFRALFVGRLVEVKRPGDFIEALSLASLLYHPELTVSAAIVGEGPLSASLRQSIRSEGLEGSVTMLGELGDPAPEYRRADVLVSTSATEGVPNVVLEAMSWGLPVIATDVGGVAEVVRDGETGFLVPPSNPQAVAVALGRLAGDPQLARRLGARGREKVKQLHSPSIVSARLERLLQSHIDQSRQR